MATLREALAIALQHHQTGRLDAAEQIYRQILVVEPNHSDAIHLLGVLAAQAGNHEAAIEQIGRAIRLQGNVPFYHFNLGEAYRALQRASDAAACYRRTLQLKPDYAEAHSNLGSVLLDQGQPDEAAICCRRALQWKPELAEAHNNLGSALKAQGKLDEAVACYRRALELKPNYPEAHNNLGAALHDQGTLDEAAACYRRALELKPDYAETHNNLGIALAEAGDLQGAEASFRTALGHNPRFALAHYKLAELLGGGLPEEDLAAQRQLAARTELPDGQRLLLHFALAHVLDARGQYAEASQHLERGNALQLAQWRERGQGYDPGAYASLVTRMMAVCTLEFFQRVGGFGSSSEVPVFVVGLPRSGTTLIEQILAGHSQVFGAGEIHLAGETLAALGGKGTDPIEGLHWLDRATAERLAARHLENLRTLDPAALRVVDKLPDNYLFLGLLAALFPRAKLIHCRRDLRDTAVSCWMTHFRELRWTNDPQHIASRFHEYRRIMEHWRQVLPVPLLEVDYEETVADLEGIARKLAAWCGLAWEPGCLDFHRAKRPVRTASSIQVRQPVFATSVGRWKHYEPYLAALLRALPDG